MKYLHIKVQKAAEPHWVIWGQEWREVLKGQEQGSGGAGEGQQRASSPISVSLRGARLAATS
jgi:hypothetical protein